MSYWLPWFLMVQNNLLLCQDFWSSQQLSLYKVKLCLVWVLQFSRLGIRGLSFLSRWLYGTFMASLTWNAFGCIWESMLSTLHYLCLRCHRCPHCHCCLQGLGALLFLVSLQSLVLLLWVKDGRQLCHIQGCLFFWHYCCCRGRGKMGRNQDHRIETGVLGTTANRGTRVMGHMAIDA